MFVISLILILPACKSKRDKTFDNIYSQRIVYPQNLKNCNNNIDSVDNFFKSKVKIVTTADLGCSKCCGELMNLEKFIDSLNLKQNLSLIIYNYAHFNQLSIFDFLLHVENFKYPIYNDSLKEFIKTNNLPEDNLIFHTFLVDKKDSIRVIGSPIGNKKISELYKKEIKKILEED